jgi:hypothetical protein
MILSTTASTLLEIDWSKKVNLDGYDSCHGKEFLCHLYVEF